MTSELSIQIMCKFRWYANNGYHAWNVYIMFGFIDWNGSARRASSQAATWITSRTAKVDIRARNLGKLDFSVCVCRVSSQVGRKICCFDVAIDVFYSKCVFYTKREISARKGGSVRVCLQTDCCARLTSWANPLFHLKLKSKKRLCRKFT